MNDLLNLLSPSRMRIVEFIKRQGAVTVEQTVAALGLAETTIRQHFDRLEAMDLLERQSVANGPGRPTMEYRLSGSGQQLFPTQNGPLFGKAIEFLVQQGYPGLVDTFFRQIWQERREELVQQLEETGATTLAERLSVVEDFLSREGFVPEIEVDGACVTIRECNCPFSEGVRATRLPCRLEAQFLEHALQRDLSRVGYMPEGHPACVYEFQLADGDALADAAEEN